VDGDIRENLAVHRDIGGIQALDESTVGQTLGTDSSAETCDPKGAEIALAGLAIAVGPVFSLHLRVFRVAEEFGTAAAVALRGVDDAFAAGAAGWRVCGSWHVL